MKLTGNTILVTGGGSGIGRGLAEELLKLGNTVIIAGRRKSALEETLAANPGMKSIELDIEDAAGIPAFAERLVEQFPTLNVLINNAGIMRPESLKAAPENLPTAEAILAINLLGPIRLTSALLPHLLKQDYAAVMNVTSGLAYVPLVFTPTYCATKAAIHSYTLSLRYQLRGTNVEVLELAPPYVQTNLMDGAEDPRAMPLPAFIAESMEILKSGAQDIYVKNVHPLRYAEQQGKFEEVFEGLNGAMSARFAD
jgi:uncharacterized oxidoreductase